MGADQPRRRPQISTGSLTSADQGRLDLGGDETPAPVRTERSSPEGRVVRVLPDVVGIDREFDYLVPRSWDADGRAERVAVGSMVRVSLGGRRVAGWVTHVDVEPAPGIRLAELAKLSGMGPSSDVIELARWAAWRWAGRTVPFLRAASPPRMVAAPVSTKPSTAVAHGPRDQLEHAFDHPVAIVRVSPDDDGLELARAACRRGDALIVAADASRARHLALALRRTGVRVALFPDDWAMAAGGCTVVGSRAAAWAPMPSMAAAIVIDEHDERLKEEKTPAWHARDVVVERARRHGVPVVMTSAVPSLEALRAGALLRADRATERDGWPVIDVLDRRGEDPAKAGLFAEKVRDHMDGDRRVVCVLNRKGRARLLACSQCGELVRSDDGTSLMRLEGGELVDPTGQERRPVVCAECGSTALKMLRVGVDRAAEELAALLGEPVAEMTADSSDDRDLRVTIGTEAALHRMGHADVVVFLDFDQELLSVRQRAAEQSMGMLALAARVVGGRSGGGRVVIQTRQPDHEVIRAAKHADPSIVAKAERDRRKPLHLPPYGGQVEISGAGGSELVERFGDVEGVTIRGPRNDRWLLRSAEPSLILDRLAEIDRPAARVRVEVDPLRV